MNGTDSLNDVLHDGLHDALLQRIQQLSFPAYCHLIRLLLYRSGYTSVQIVEPGISKASRRKSAMSRRKSAPSTATVDTQTNDVQHLLYSGLLAVSHTDLASALTLVRVKQAKGAPVSRRFVDQLRGAMLRLGAEQGMLIATGRFSRYAVSSATQAPLPPVRLMAGDALCAMLVERGLGVRQVSMGKAPSGKNQENGEERDSKEQHKEQCKVLIDEPFFQLLETQAQRQHPTLQIKGQQQNKRQRQLKQQKQPKRQCL